MYVGSWSFLLLVLLAFCVFMIISSLLRQRRQLPRAPGQQLPSELQKDRYRSERKRILSMLASRSITPEEGSSLLDALEREGSTKLCPYCEQEIQMQAVICKHCHQHLDAAPQAIQRLSRGSQLMFLGVCSGVAEYMKIDPTLIRLVVALLAVFSGILPGLFLYLVIALILPPASSTGVQA